MKDTSLAATTIARRRRRQMKQQQPRSSAAKAAIVVLSIVWIPQLLWHDIPTSPAATTTSATTAAVNAASFVTTSSRRKRINERVVWFPSPSHTSTLFSSNSLSNTIQEFIHQVNQSLGELQTTNKVEETNGSFQSFTLYYFNPTKKQQSKEDEGLRSQWRGRLKLVTGRCIQLVNKGKKKSSTAELFLQATFKYHWATDIVKNWPLPLVPQALETVLMLDTYEDNSIHLHRQQQLFLPSSEWEKDSTTRQSTIPVSLLGVQRARLETTRMVFEMDCKANRLKVLPVTPKSRSSRNLDTDSSQAGLLMHDRPKQVPLDSVRQMEFLHALGLIGADGKPKPGQQAAGKKLRQAQKFVEIVHGLIQGVLLGSNHTTKEINVTDMGCGRGYLTFAIHDFLMDQYNPNQNTKTDVVETHEEHQSTSLRIRTRGIEVRPKLVRDISNIARSLGPKFDDLVFEEGTIESFVAKHTNTNTPRSYKDVAVSSSSSSSAESLEILIALHACDTATDDALWSGITAQADVIVVAPCCHKQVRPQLDRHARATNKNTNHHPYQHVLCHAIYRERMAETVTDSVRALLLQLANYQVQVFEFIGGEHTSKNTMITAVKRTMPLSKANQQNLRQGLQSLCELHGIQTQKLASWMNESLSSSTSAQQQQQQHRKPILSVKRMPPIFDERTTDWIDS